MNKFQLYNLSQSLSDLYKGLETDLIFNIADYLAKGNIDVPNAKWKIQMLAELGALDRKNINTISSYFKNAPDLINTALTNASLSAIEELEPGFQELVKEGILSGTEVPIEKTMARSLQTFYKQANQALNLVNTTMLFKAKSAASKIINDTAELANKQSFIDILNKSAAKAVTGIESRQAAMRQCIKEMTDKGIPGFVDKTGRVWSPEAYVNMTIRTTASNTAHQAQMDRMDDYGIDLVEVSSHAGARPKCARDQGKIFNRSGKGGYTTDLYGNKIKYYAWSESSYGEPDGLLGINCGHHIYPFISGINVQRYFTYDKEENDKQYQLIQQQREYERRVRKSKHELMVLDKTGDKSGFTKASVTLKNREQALKKFCSDNNLSYKPDRTAVVGYNRSISGKATSVSKNLSEKSSKNPTLITDGSIEKVPVIKSKAYTNEQNDIIQSKHKELLKYARDENNSNEVAFIFGNNFSSEVHELGKTDALTFSSREANDMLIYGENLFVMHNHPKNSSYSMNDINFFVSHNNIKSLSIVKNNGSIEMLTKSDKYNIMDLQDSMKKLVKRHVKAGTDIEYDKLIKALLTENGGNFIHEYK